MITIKKVPKWFLCVLFLVTVLRVAYGWTQEVPPLPGGAAKNFLADKGSSKKVSMDFDNVDIRLVIKFMSELTGKNFILDDRVKGKVTVLSPTQIPVKDAYRIFESIMEVNGYTTVTSGNVVKVVPDSTAASKNLETVTGESSDIGQESSDAMVTQLIPLEYADAERVKAILQPLISRESKILSYLPTNTLILTERASNINRLMAILKEIDVETEDSIISVIPIQHGDVDNLTKQLQTLFGERANTYHKSQKSHSGQGSALKILPDSRTGNIIVLSDPEQLEEIKELLKQLDVPVPRDKDDIHVYFLKNSKADDMAKVLAQIMSKTMTTKGAKDSKPDTPLTVVADKATNSLIITASSVDYSVIERVLQKLDIMRPQVLVEALIAEVSYDKSRELGVEWRAMREPSGHDSILPLAGTSFGKINEVIANPMAPPGGMFIGLTKGYINMGGLSFPNLAALVAAYQTDNDVNILSTPHILTTDNEEAEIIVGQEVPFAGAREVLSNNASNSIYSINYKNVGLTLRITPHINQDDYVKLEIYQEIKQIASTTISQAGPTPTTTIRQAKTSVVVKDGQTVVLGGLIQDDKFDNSQRVPCLGSIPIIGLAFKSMNKRNQKRNLQIFITPHIIKEPEDIDVFTSGMKNQLRSQEGKTEVSSPQEPQETRGSKQPQQKTINRKQRHKKKDIKQHQTIQDQEQQEKAKDQQPKAKATDPVPQPENAGQGQQEKIQGAVK
ncbi:MAG: type II secretion system secretin GspD [bacterium]